MVLRTLRQVLADEALARDAAWDALRAMLGVDAPDDDVAALVLDDPAAHSWRTVDAALDRLACRTCGAVLGSGERGCRPCDFADGSRFLGDEQDRPGVPAGNEHAVRVSVTVVRNAHRWPSHAVEGNRLYLPRFAEGDMPTRQERYVLAAGLRAGLPAAAADAETFSEMAAVVRRSQRDGDRGPDGHAAATRRGRADDGTGEQS